jgi:hypothetical protein
MLTGIPAIVTEDNRAFLSPFRQMLAQRLDRRLPLNYKSFLILRRQATVAQSV